jgi:phosphate ABC transporter permease protein PstC/phosphate ABC transporter permease subunit PstA
LEVAPTPVSGGRSSFERSPLSRLPDQILKFGLSGIAVVVLLLIAYFFVRLIGQSSTAFSHIGVLNFFITNNWDVSQVQQGSACAVSGGHCTFGAWALVLGTLITAATALIIGVPVAVAAALFLTELCPRRARAPLGFLVDLLAAVPSVVYGLWGVFVLIPKLRPAEQWFADTFSFLPFVSGQVAGPGYFVAGLILAIMILPIVCAIAREVISTVPTEQKEASLALGATRWEMLRMSVLPYSRAGITGAAMLGLGRAIGETIAVVLVIGNSPTLGKSIFSQGYTLASVIANEFGEAASTPVHRSALFAAGLALFVLTLLVNVIARRYVTRANRLGSTGGKVRGRRKVAAASADPAPQPSLTSAAATSAPSSSERQPTPEQPPESGTGTTRHQTLPTINAGRRLTDRAMRGILAALTAVALVPLVLVIYFLLHKGLSAWTGNFFTTDPNGNFLGYPGGIRSAILGTVEMTALATLIAVPLGIGVALYLTEYGKNSRFANTVRYFLDVMSGVPSIVFGLFIYIVLVLGGIGGGFTGWKGSVALSLLMLPVVARASEVVLLLVPASLREAALALGAPRWRVVGRVVLPTALSGLVTGSLLAIARAAGETAPLLFTAFGAQVLSTNLGAPMNALPLQIYGDILSPRPSIVERAWGAALTLVVLILILNLIARVASRRTRLA